MYVGISIWLISAAWLLPNHYPPWTSAWNDGLAIISLLLLLTGLSATANVRPRISRPFLYITFSSLVVIALQLLYGHILFAGDALMAAQYVGLWFAALLAGGLIASKTNTEDNLKKLTASWLFIAIASVGIALVQWTGALSLGIYGVDLPFGGRPYANVAQPNNFCSICFLGLCSLLWLHQTRRVSGIAFALSCAFLLLGMLLSQSRTGWLQVALLVVWGWTMRTRLALRISRLQLFMLGLAFGTGVLLWPGITDLLLLSGSRTIPDQMLSGMRVPFWIAMLDAIWREPLWGYGWQQVGLAQQSVALDHPAVGDFFEHSHNFALDLMLWNGVPVGALILGLLVWWFIMQIRACRDGKIAWMLAAIGGVATHSLLEFPLEYAYFLIPVGLVMGAVDSLSVVNRDATISLPRAALPAMVLCLGGVLIATAIDYLKAEQTYRALRMESARIGTDRVTTVAPDLPLLTQLGAFLEFMATEAKPGMPPQRVAWMRSVSQRFGYPSVMFRYALAAGLNGQPEAAAKTLAQLCRIHPPARCHEAREGWLALQSQYPQLQKWP